MKFLAIASALLGIASAQLQCLSIVAQIPTCGIGCITSAASAVSCDALDFACQCNSASNSKIQALAQTCVLASCTDITTALKVQSVAGNICSCQAQPQYVSQLAAGSTVPMPTSTGPAPSINTAPDVSANAAPTGGKAPGIIGALMIAVAAL
ncbi:MAG: hypothetical protein MMC23_001339 [Stictis urceolatum]|nr:hypothetical protein [Stictis urceolata]